MKRLLVLSVLVLAIGASPAYAILNGVPDGSAHPYVGMATWTAPDGRRFLCTGTRISEHRFLTAAHCFPRGSTATIVFDENGAASPTAVYTGIFTPSSTSDVAIIEVTGGMPGLYANLPVLGSVAQLPMKQVVTSVGYGLRVPPKDFAGEFRQRYQATSELIQDSSSKSDSFIKLSANPAQGKGGTCFGDSGGPSLIGDTIVGITSFGHSNCTGISYAQRVDIPSVRIFIDSFGP